MPLHSSSSSSMALATPDAVVLELMTMGQQSAVHLGHLLRSSSPASPHQELAAEILSCCDRVIAALTANGGKKRKAIQHDSPASARSPPSAPPRKRARCGGEAIGVETSSTMVDGFIWRKYGQKEINGRKHPRLYYRCAYKDQGCPARRRVQRTHEDDEPAAYEIAYYGHHTCKGAAACLVAAVAPPPTVVDFGSNSLGCGTAPAVAPEQPRPRFCDGEMSSQGGWSPASASSEVGFEAQTAHEWHGMAGVEMPSPCDASDPVTQFLDGCFDWESVINDAPFDFPALFSAHCHASLQ